jgi:murein DD-endopeptidase MepM/ murein hydrolase activator NlpD
MQGVNPITGKPFFARDPKGQSGHERPGAGGKGNFGACRGQACSRTHQGEDISGQAYFSPVHASTGGTVTFSGLNGSKTDGYGETVKIDSGDGVVTVYSHNAANGVSEGEHVTQGEVIAIVGQTGNAHDAPEGEAHVHFEVQVNGTRVDPAVWLNSTVDTH